VVRLFNVYHPARKIVLLAGETLIICASFLLAAVIRLGDDSSLMLNYENGFYKIAVASVVYLICMYYYDLYDSLPFVNPRENLTRLVQVLGTGCMIMAFVYAVLPGIRLELGLFLSAVALVGLALAVWRKVFLALSTSPRFARRALILGAGPLIRSLRAEVERRPEWGVRVLGYVGGSLEDDNGSSGCRLGEVEDLAAIVERERVDEIIVTMVQRRGQLPVEALLDLKTQGVKIRDGLDVYEMLSGKVPLDSLKLSWLLFSPGFQVSRSILIYKRVFSFALSFVGLLLTLPLMVLIAIAIRLDSEGPVIFQQERVGKHGKVFKLTKFRSMKADCDADGECKPAEENDDRFTRVGRWLRRLRLDELPQLYNILRGDMYFVGPRPFVPSQEEEFAAKIPFYRQRWSVKPGATGWAQINRGYCATLEDNREKLSYDLFYIKHMSTGLDLLIIFRTIKILLLGRGGR